MFFGGDFGLKLKLNITNGIIGQLMQLMSETSLDSNLTGFVLANHRSNLSIESYEIKIYCRGVFKSILGILMTTFSIQRSYLVGLDSMYPLLIKLDLQCV